MDLFEALNRSRDEFEKRLRLVTPDQWKLPTPCDGWDVRELVNHTVGGARRYEMLLHGATPDEVAATRSMDHLGDNPIASFQRLTFEMTAAFHEPAALFRTVHHPAGDRSGEDLLWLRIAEFSVHGWDLARAIGADEVLDPSLVEALLERLSTVGTGLAEGDYFEPPPGELPDDVDPQTKLLLLTGRRPKINGTL